MSIAEIIQQLNKGRLKVVRIIYKKGDGYYAVFGKGFPREYDIIEVKPGLVVYRLGNGSRKAWMSGVTARYRVPAKAKPKEGYAFAEIHEDLVYLYLG